MAVVRSWRKSNCVDWQILSLCFIETKIIQSMLRKYATILQLAIKVAFASYCVPSFGRANNRRHISRLGSQTNLSSSDVSL